jgi:hypothetical protein
MHYKGWKRASQSWYFGGFFQLLFGGFNAILLCVCALEMSWEKSFTNIGFFFFPFLNSCFKGFNVIPIYVFFFARACRRDNA